MKPINLIKIESNKKEGHKSRVDKKRKENGPARALPSTIHHRQQKGRRRPRAPRSRSKACGLAMRRRQNRGKKKMGRGLWKERKRDSGDGREGQRWGKTGVVTRVLCWRGRGGGEEATSSPADRTPGREGSRSACIMRSSGVELCPANAALSSRVLFLSISLKSPPFLFSVVLLSPS